MSSKRHHSPRLATAWLGGATLASCLLMLAGCQGSDRVAIEGEVTWEDGRPLKNGSIIFEPAEGTAGPRVGGLIEAGQYRLPRRDGPVPGSYLVRISATGIPEAPLDDPLKFAEQGEALLPSEQIAPQFNSQTKLTAEVSREQREFDFQVAPADGQASR